MWQKYEVVFFRITNPTINYKSPAIAR